MLNADRQCTIRCYPHDDVQFDADAQMVLAESRKLASRRHDLLELVRQRMTQLYPDVTIQPRNPIAAGDDPNELWYCYRDGGLLGPPSDWPDARRGPSVAPLSRPAPRGARRILR